MTAQRPIPTFAFYERLVMRLLFAWLVWRATPATLIVNGIPSPNGITHLFDLHFLLDPHVFSVRPGCLAAALILYVLRWLSGWRCQLRSLSISRPTDHEFARCNSTRGPDCLAHSLRADRSAFLRTLATAHGEEERRSWRAAPFGGRNKRSLPFICSLESPKLFVTKGLWIFQARWIGVSIAKAAYQKFYNDLRLGRSATATGGRHFAAAHGWIVALIAGVGLFLELGSPLMLGQPRLGRDLGRRADLFPPRARLHDGSEFIFNQWALAIFMINAPYWIATGSEGRRYIAARSHPHDLIPAVDVNDLAGNRGRAVAGEENSGLPKLGGIATASERSAFLIMLQH